MLIRTLLVSQVSIPLHTSTLCLMLCGSKCFSMRFVLSSHMMFSAVMGKEMQLSDLVIGPFEGAQARHYHIMDAPPNPKQTKLRCSKCLLFYTAASTPLVNKDTDPVTFTPKWHCYSHKVALAADPCSACPLCSRDDGLTRRRIHMCADMVRNNVYTPLLLPCRMMLDYTRCGAGCSYCGFNLAHMVCECRLVSLLLQLKVIFNVRS